MSFFTKKNFLFKLIVCICIFLTLINITGGTRVYAADGAETGGKLLKPVVDLVLAVGDAVFGIIHKTVMGADADMSVSTAKGWLETIAGVLSAAFFIAVAVGIIALINLIPVVGQIITGAIGTVLIASGAIGGFCLGYAGVSGTSLPETVVLPLYTLGPEEIFKGQILLFDVNIFNPKEVYVELNYGENSNAGLPSQIKLSEWKNIKEKYANGNSSTREEYIANAEADYYFYYKDGNSGNKDDSNIIKTSINNSAYDLKSSVSKWYYTIRNIAIIALMIALVYIGIRMLLSSTAGEKSKYKQMLGDWLVGICLVFLMHYIMVFGTTFTDSIVTLLADTSNEIAYDAKIINPPDKLVEVVKSKFDPDGSRGMIESGTNNINWITNRMGYIRILAQQQGATLEYVGYALCYIALVFYTVSFVIVYLKRLLYIVFLTIIAPLVAVTYPLDKIHDGKAQAFDIWLKEYIFNLIIQPFHLLLYLVLIDMAIELSTGNIIYSLVALGFMVPAEKFLRKMFGFDKASTPGLLSGAAGAAVAMSAMNSLGKMASKGPNLGKMGKDGSGGKSDDNKRLRTADSDKSLKNLFESAAGNNNSEVNLIDENAGEGKNFQQQDSQPEMNDDERRKQESPEYGPTENSSDAGGFPETDQLGDTRPEDNNDKQGKKKIKGSNLRAIGRGFARNYKNAFKSTVPNALSTAAKVTTGVAGGLLGAGMGISSGDINAVAKNTTMGAGAGSAIGAGVTNTVIGSVAKGVSSGSETVDQWRRDKYGSDYSDVMKQKADDEFVKNKENRRLYADELGLKKKAEIDIAMQQARKYREYGITDNTTIIKAMRVAEKNNMKRDDQKMIAAAKIADISKSNKEFDENMSRFAKTKGVTEQKVQQMRDLATAIRKDFV